MAHRADAGRKPARPESLPGIALEEADVEADTGDLAALDQLIAATDDGWDVEAQVQTLKRAAGTKPLAEGAASIRPPMPSLALHIPTAMELAPTQVSLAPRDPSRDPSRDPTRDLSREPTRVVPDPPPSAPRLAGRASTTPVRPSKGPPPLPRKAPALPGAPTGATASTRASPPPSRSPYPELVDPEPSSVRMPADMLQPSALIELLQARVATLERGTPREPSRSTDAKDTRSVATDAPWRALERTIDKLGLSRAHVELAIASETILGDDGRASAHAEAALRVDPTSAAAHAMLRRRRHGRGALGAMLGHLEQELGAATTETHRAELLAEKARLLEAIGGRSADVRATWERALFHAPTHAAALRGLESELAARASANGSPQDWDALATHLGRLADAYASDPRLAAWLHVERAGVLERKLDRSDAARAGLERALQLDGSVGPVRDALVRHAAAHADWSALSALLDEEARIEPSAARAARLELDAASIAAARLGDRTKACALLERAAARAPTAAAVDRRVLDELVRLHELGARWADAARARRARLRFVTDPASTAHELRALAAAGEREGDLEAAVGDVQRALAVDATDPTLIDTLDRLLAALGKNDQRIATWLQEAARIEDGTRRARALGRAALVCEELGRQADAVKHLRAAWVAAPGDAEVLDALARLLAPARPESTDAGARALVDLYTQAADHAKDAGRKVVYLDRVALLWEEVLGEPARAAKAYDQVLGHEPDRRSAIVGLGRTAARSGDARALSRALIEEARLAADAPVRLTLRTRAASALAKEDPLRAIEIVRDVLDEDAGHSAARALETRLAEEAGRWELAAKSLRGRIGAAQRVEEKVALWLALAQHQHARLHEPLEALASLEQARALDPTHPVPPEQIVQVLEDHGDARALRDAVERLATHARSPQERVRFLTRAAEIDELRLNDDASAMRTYQRALAEDPDDELVADRLGRVAARRAQQGHRPELAELAALLGKRAERASTPEAAHALSFGVASLLVEIGQDPTRAVSLLEGALAAPGDHVHALRLLESVRRRGGDAAALARVLTREGDELKDVRARLGALWNLAALEEWRTGAPPEGANGPTTYQRILALDPTDPGALEATLRRDLANARRGDPAARKSVGGALRGLVAFASDDGTRLAHQLRLALMLESAAADAADDATTEGLSREALDRYGDALRIDGLSVTASTGLARLAGKLGDAPAALAAARALAEVAVEPRVRARYLVDAAELLLGPDESERLGQAPERRAQAVAMLERAIEADADSIPAAGRLATVLLEERQGERLVSTFRGALVRARSPDAIVMLGSEIARVARDDLLNVTLAIDAMVRVRAAAPQHVPSLLTLAELCIAQRAWPEAVDALEAVVSTSREIPPKLTALFALASIYEKVLARTKDLDRVLRAALALEPRNARALRALLRRVAAEATQGDEATLRARREELAGLLARVAEVEKDPEQRTIILLELAEMQIRRGDAAGAERALVDAVAVSPQNTRAVARLASFFRRDGGTDSAGYARALAAVIAAGQQLGHVDARWFATLGTIEIHDLSRTRDGIAHLQRAATLDPTLYEARFELASAHARSNGNGDAIRALLAMIIPSATPLLGISDPAAGLALLETTLLAERRPDEAMVASELRAIAGDLDDDRVARLRGRRPPPDNGYGASLDRPALVTQVLPGEGRHILLEVAAAIAGVEAKMLRSDLSDVGLSARDRITARVGHPLRTLLDRVARMLGVTDIEIAIGSTPRVRVLSQDAPWIVVPQRLTEQPVQVQAAALARAVARVAFGVPWLAELPPPQVEALLVAAARQVVPSYAQDALDAHTSSLAVQQEATLGRVLSRRQRKLLEELAPHIAAPQARPPVIQDFVQALTRAELRAAFLVSGELLAVFDDLRWLDPALQRATATPGVQALGAALQHPLVGDLARYALLPDATAMRRRLGSVWSGSPSP